MSLLRSVTRSVTRPVMRSVMGNVLLDNPLIATLGASTMRMNNAASANKVYYLAGGPHQWALTFEPNFRNPIWKDTGDARGFYGFNFGHDGDPIATQLTYLPAILASEATVFDWRSGRVDTDVDASSGATVASYCDPVKAAFLQAKAAGLTCRWFNNWLRDTSVGGIWAAGTTTRALVLAINTEMNAWCPANGVYVLDEYTVMTDPGSADQNPKALYFTTDGVHFASKGGYECGKILRDSNVALFKPAARYNPADAANVFPYKGFPGTGGTLVNGALGVVPDSMTIERGGAGNARSCTGAKVVVGGNNFEEITIGSAGTVVANGEGVNFRITTFPVSGILTIGKWYEFRCRIECGDWNGWTGFKAMFEHTSADGGGGMSPTSGSDGATLVTGFSAAAQYNIRAGEAWDGVLHSLPFLATATTMAARVVATYTNGTGGGVFSVGDFDVREVDNPVTALGVDQVDALAWNGTTRGMRKASGLTGAADSAVGLVSYWVDLKGADATRIAIFDSTALDFERNAANLMRLNLTVAEILSAGTYTAADGWLHILASWNLAFAAGQKLCHLYINDVNALGSFNDFGNPSSVVDWTDAAYGAFVNDAGTSRFFNGDGCEMYINNAAYMDLSITANRRKFITSDLKPAFLGQDGSYPTGAKPIVYFSVRPGAAATGFLTNRGTGGNFVAVGTLALAATSPSD